MKARGFPRDHISVSQINLYLICPLKYRFAYVDRLPKPFKPVALAFGSAIHSALEWWHKKRLGGSDPGWKAVCQVFGADFTAQKEDNLRFSAGATAEKLLEQGTAMLACYLKEYQGGLVQSVEMPFRVPLLDQETGELLDLPLEGYIDLVEENDVVVDLKTAARNYSLFDVTQHLQLTAYSYAYGQLYERPARLRIDCLLKTKKPKLVSWETERAESDHVRFFHIAKAVMEGIRNGQFHPCPGWQCAGCEYFEPCQRWRCDGESESAQSLFEQRRISS